MKSPASLRQFSIPQWMVDLGLMVVVGILFGFWGLFGTDRAPLAVSLVYWMAVMPAGGVCVLASEWVLKRVLPVDWPRFAAILGTAALAALPQTFLVLLADNLIMNGDFLTAPSAAVMISIIIRLYGAVFIVMMGMVPLLRLVRAQARPAIEPIPPVKPGPADTLAPFDRPPLMERLPNGLKSARLIALEAEDHYVRVHTDAGSELTLLRLVDGIRETAPIDGFRTHRSWWVARDAIQSAQFKRGSGSVTVTGGREIPVSRSFAPQLREAGILPSLSR